MRLPLILLIFLISYPALSDSIIMVAENLVVYDSNNKVLEEETARWRKKALGKNLEIDFYSNGNILKIKDLKDNKEIFICDRLQNDLFLSVFSCTDNYHSIKPKLTLKTLGSYIREGVMKFNREEKNIYAMMSLKRK